VALLPDVSVVAIVQARMTSSRFPGKVLAELAGAPMLAQELRRLAAARSIGEIVVATTRNATDDPVAALADVEGARVFRGDEHDVLGRYVAAAREARADVVVRITADCPLLDPGVVDRVVEALTDDADYSANVVERTFPQGLDCEALHLETLERVDGLAESPAAREHVTWLINNEQPDLFARVSVVDEDDNSDLRWTVDLPADLELVRRLYDRFQLVQRRLPYRDLIDAVRADPELAPA
jgi:spore coat polysaccharide biosynthesis protein SpsF